MEKFFVTGGCSTEQQLFTGVGKCDVAEGVVDYLLITRSTAKFDVPANGDFTDTIKNALALDYKDPNKMWIIGKITTNNAPEGGDMITNTKGTRGGSITTGQNPISIAYAMPAGICLFNQLSKFNGMECRVFRLDRNKNVFGVFNAEENKLMGFSASIWVTNTPEADGGDVEMASINVSYGVDYFTQEFPKRSNVKVTEIPNALRPIAIVKGESANTFSIKYTCSGEQLDDATASLLIDGEDFPCFVAQGEVTAITYSAGVFTATGATAIKLSSPTILQENGVFGIEGYDEFITIA